MTDSSCIAAMLALKPGACSGRELSSAEQSLSAALQQGKSQQYTEQALKTHTEHGLNTHTEHTMLKV